MLKLFCKFKNIILAEENDIMMDLVIWRKRGGCGLCNYSPLEIIIVLIDNEDYLRQSPLLIWSICLRKRLCTIYKKEMKQVSKRSLSIICWEICRDRYFLTQTIMLEWKRLVLVLKRRINHAKLSKQQNNLQNPNYITFLSVMF